MGSTGASDSTLKQLTLAGYQNVFYYYFQCSPDHWKKTCIPMYVMLDQSVYGHSSLLVFFHSFFFFSFFSFSIGVDDHPGQAAHSNDAPGPLDRQDEMQVEVHSGQGRNHWSKVHSSLKSILVKVTV